MKISALLILLLSSSLSFLSAQKEYNILQIDHWIHADGMLDYDSTLLISQKESPFYFAILKYEEHLFVILEVANEKVQNQIMMTGLQLNFIVKGKSGFLKSIRYPQGIPVRDRPSDPEMLEAFEKAIQIKKEEISQKMDQMELIGFYGKEDTVWGKNRNDDGIIAAFGFNKQGKMIYEAKIPFSTVFNSDDQIEHFRIRVETGILGRPYLIGAKGVGIGGTALSNPARIETRSQREDERKMEKYRTYTVAESMEIKKVYGLNSKINGSRP